MIRNVHLIFIIFLYLTTSYNKVSVFHDVIGNFYILRGAQKNRALKAFHYPQKLIFF